MTSAPLLLILAMIAAPPEAKATYYLGEWKVMTPEGRQVGNLVSLVKRESFPDESKLVETVLVISSNKTEPTREYAFICAVTGSSFVLKEKAGTIAGTGEWTGRPWDWTGWTTTTKIPSGTLNAQTRVTERGMSASKEFVSANGQVQLRYVEEYMSIDGGTYELFHEKIFPKNAR